MKGWDECLRRISCTLCTFKSRDMCARTRCLSFGQLPRFLATSDCEIALPIRCHFNRFSVGILVRRKGFHEAPVPNEVDEQSWGLPCPTCVALGEMSNARTNRGQNYRFGPYERQSAHVSKFSSSFSACTHNRANLKRGVNWAIACVLVSRGASKLWAGRKHVKCIYREKFCAISVPSHLLLWQF